MESIIKHLVKMTGYRDHDLLNISIASSLREILDAESARVFELTKSDQGILLCPKVHITATTVDAIEHAEKFPLSGRSPELMQLQTAIAERLSMVEILSDGVTLIDVLLWNEGQLESVIRLRHPTKKNINTLDVVNGMLIVYKNFHALLDYNECDSLTGLLNRKTFDDSYTKLLRLNSGQTVLESALTQVLQAETELETVHQHWLAVADIDHFKRVNDQFGHLYGDEVLILIANLMRESFQSDDHLFRFGGEEFLILLHATSLENAQEIFENFRQRVEQYSFPQVGQITISVGFSRIDTFEPAVAIVGRADQALYYAKSHGRNQVCLYDNLVANGDLQQEYANDIAEFF